jgi:hypothetical protein
LFLFVGLLWGLLLAAIVGFVVSGIAAGAAWIWLFGDETWPEWAGSAIIGAGVAAGAITFFICMFIARIVANRHGSGDEGDAEEGGGAFAWFLILLALAGAGGFGWYHYDNWNEQRLAAKAARDAAAYFTTLQAETHKVTDIAVDWPGGGLDGAAQVTLDGQRAGVYRLDWRLRNSLFDKPVMQGSEALELAAGAGQIDIPLPAEEVVSGYRSLLERQDAYVLVDEPFVLETRLTPVLAGEEESRIPQAESRNLTLNASGLIHEAAKDFKVRFHLYGDIVSWEG